MENQKENQTASQIYHRAKTFYNNSSLECKHNLEQSKVKGRKLVSFIAQLGQTVRSLSMKSSFEGIVCQTEDVFTIARKIQRLFKKIKFYLNKVIGKIQSLQSFIEQAQFTDANQQLEQLRQSILIKVPIKLQLSTELQILLNFYNLLQQLQEKSIALNNFLAKQKEIFRRLIPFSQEFGNEGMTDFANERPAGICQ